ncbi:hypothetical protein [Methanofollis fontis]|uniref:hypothetical protein n=1 Tax=Methanofollis fontis TaxID=2052832 RepID=UPI0013EE5CAD|nr:hypothetical protein [Methanofollis fontis]
MSESRYTPVLLLACLLAPVNIFVIGDFMGAGIRFPLVLYQHTIYGTSWIPIWQEVNYVATGLIGGRSGLAILVWALATLLVLAAFAAWIARWPEGERRGVALLLAGAGACSLLAAFAHYGPLLHGQAGFCVPVGLPIVIAVAWFVWRGEGKEKGEDENTSPDIS